ncbi:MAG: ABC transporter permease [Proteobacteria bacterium]|nr:ABC transporter permease [Pseudomonadota bacterium]
MLRFGFIPVWKRNRDVFIKLFWVNFLLPLLEPVFYIFAFGYGLGAFVREINGFPYKVFITPAIISMAVLNSSFFYTTYSSFVKMIFQKTFDAIIVTPVSIEDVVIGEILWGTTRGIVSGLIVMTLFLILGLIKVFHFLVFLPVILVLSFTFSSLGMFFTATVKNIESFNFPIFLYFTPMMFFSGTFFPLSNIDEKVVFTSKIIFPLSFSVDALRSSYLDFTLAKLFLGFVPVIHGLVFFLMSIKIMSKKLIK